jgi:hypothetical protein
MNGVLLNKNNAMMPPTYNQYILKPSKIKSISKPLLSSGLSGEKLHIGSLAYKGNNSHNNALTNVINIENQKNSYINNHKGSLIGMGSNNYNSHAHSSNIEMTSNNSEIKKLYKKKKSTHINAIKNDGVTVE